MNRTALLLLLALLWVPGAARAGVAGGLQPGDFQAPLIERFDGPDLSSDGEDVALPSGILYRGGNAFTGLRSCTFISIGGGPGIETCPRDGDGDGHFASQTLSESFEFDLRDLGANIFRLGFYGIEASGRDVPTDGILELDFYDAEDDLIGTALVDGGDDFPWGPFHGFESSRPIARVVFHYEAVTVLEDLHVAFVPEPRAALLQAVALACLAAGTSRRFRTPADGAGRLQPAGSR